MMVVAFLISVVIFALLLLLMVFLTSKNRKPTYDREYYQSTWRQILDYASTGMAGWRLSIIEADKLLAHALKQGGYRGETMADRLRTAEKRFSRYNNLWAAHKLRNRLVHEPNVDLDPQIAKKVLAEFQLALKELGAL